MKKKPSEMAIQLTNLFHFIRWCQTPKEEQSEKQQFLDQFIDTYYGGDPSLHLIIKTAFNLPLKNLKL